MTNNPAKLAKKELGQNFLISQSHILQTINALNIEDHNRVIEIGGGQGALTKNLSTLDHTYDLDVYEIDQRFIDILNNLPLNNQINRQIILKNFLDLDIDNVYENYNIKVIGAIPYYITSPIIHKLILCKNQPKTILLIIQKEVAEKIIQIPPKANYWSSFISTYYNTEIVSVVPAEAFIPTPNVDSAIIKLTLKTDPIINIDKARWSRFLHLAYKNQRKMLNKTFNKEDLISQGINPQLRPQDISIDQWSTMYKINNNHE